MGDTNLFWATMVIVKSEFLVYLLSLVYRVILSLKPTKHFSLVVDGGIHSPSLSVLLPIYAHVTAAVPSVYRHVFVINLSRNISKVLRSVVVRPSVDVVNFMLWPVTMSHQPYDPVNFINPFAPADVSVPITVRCSGLIAWFQALGSRLSPEKAPCFFIIPEVFNGLFIGEVAIG